MSKSAFSCIFCKEAFPAVASLAAHYSEKHKEENDRLNALIAELRDKGMDFREIKKEVKEKLGIDTSTSMLKHRYSLTEKKRKKDKEYWKNDTKLNTLIARQNEGVTFDKIEERKEDWGADFNLENIRNHTTMEENMNVSSQEQKFEQLQNSSLPDQKQVLMTEEIVQGKGENEKTAEQKKIQSEREEWINLAENDPDALIYRYGKVGLDFLKRYILEKGLKDAKVSRTVIDRFLEIWDNNEEIHTDYVRLGEIIDSIVMRAISARDGRSVIMATFKNLCDLGKKFDNHPMFLLPEIKKETEKIQDTQTTPSVLSVLAEYPDAWWEHMEYARPRYELRDLRADYERLRRENERLREIIRRKYNNPYPFGYESHVDLRTPTMEYTRFPSSIDFIPAKKTEQKVSDSKPDLKFDLIDSRMDSYGAFNRLEEKIKTLSDVIEEIRRRQSEEEEKRREKEREESLMHKVEDMMKDMIRNNVETLREEIRSVKTVIPEWLKQLTPDFLIQSRKLDFEEHKWKEEHKAKLERNRTFADGLRRLGTDIGGAVARTLLEAREEKKTEEKETVESGKVLSAPCPNCGQTIYADTEAKTVKCISCGSEWNVEIE